MSQEPITITYSLEDILKEMNNKLDNLQKDVTDIKIELTEVKTDVKTLKEDVKELKSSSKAQIWTLIGILFAAVAGFLTAVGRFVINNP